MLEPVRQILSSKRIVLASSSPRRKEILQTMGLPFEIIKSNYEEDLDVSKYKPQDFVMATALNKVDEVKNRLKTDQIAPDLLIGADTMVAVDGKVIGKPADKQLAYNMLTMLSGRSHKVYTGVVLMTRTETVKFFEETTVFMAPLDFATTMAYIETGEPMDKAGAYGIQGLGGSLISKIEGDYFNVMGLPLHSLCKHILQLCVAKKL